MSKQRKGPTPPRQWLPLIRTDVVVDDAAYQQWAAVTDPGAQCWENPRYVVIATPADLVAGMAGPVHLSIRRRDRKAVHDWRDLQRIKNDVAGPEREAVELYPAEARMVDTANQYHLWVAPEGVQLEVGFAMGRVVADEAGAITQDGLPVEVPDEWDTGNARQRPGLTG